MAKPQTCIPLEQVMLFTILFLKWYSCVLPLLNKKTPTKITAFSIKPFKYKVLHNITKQDGIYIYQIASGTPHIRRSCLTELNWKA